MIEITNGIHFSKKIKNWHQYKLKKKTFQPYSAHLNAISKAIGNFQKSAHKKTPTRYRVGAILLFLVNPAGLEPATVCLEGRCSIQLSYESKPIGWGEEVVGKTGLEPATLWSQTRCATTCATSRTNHKLLFAERLGLEPRGRYRDHSLAGCCITTLPPFR